MVGDRSSMGFDRELVGRSLFGVLDLEGRS
jgi:hypothetical protein